MEKKYVEQHNQGYRIAGSRVSLESVVFAFLEGLSPETIAAECFPTLSLEQVYGAIAFYLAHQTEIDVYLKQANTEFETLRQTFRKVDPAFTHKLTRAKRRPKVKRP